MKAKAAAEAGDIGHRNYCCDCDWSASTNDHTWRELADLALNHAEKTQHTIKSESISLSPSTSDD